MRKSFFSAFALAMHIVCAQGTSNSEALDLYNQILSTRNPNTVLGLLESADLAGVQEDSLKSYLYYYKGSAYGQIGQMDSALYYVDIASQALRGLDYPIIEIQILRAFGNINWSRSFFNTALQNYQDALKISQRLDHAEFQVSLLGNIAGIYAKLDNLPLALEYALEAEDISQESGIMRPRSHMKIGNYQLDLGQYQEGIKNIKETIRRIQIDNRDSIALGVCYNYLARGYFRLDLLRESAASLETAGAIFEALGYRDPYYHRDWALVELKRGNLTRAQQQLDEGLAVAQRNGDLNEVLAIKKVVRQLEEQQGSLRKALSVQDEIVALTDSIKSQETLNRVYELEAQFQTAQKDQQLALAQLELERQERFQTFLFVVLGIIVLFSGIAIFLILQRAKLRRALLFQEIDTLRAQILTILPNSEDSQIEFAKLNEGLVTPLSDREMDVLRLALSEKSNREIASELFVSINTVKTHLKNLYGKLGVSNRNEALEVILQSTK